MRGDGWLLERALDVMGAESPTAFVKGLVELAVAITDARRAYAALQLPDDVLPLTSATHGCSDEDVARIRDGLSRGVVAEAIATGTTVVTASARLDSRFRDRPSVRQAALDAVVCAPFGRPPAGVLYIEGHREGGAFRPEDVAWIERLSAMLARPALLIARDAQRAGELDPTAPFRQRFPALRRIAGRSAALAATFEAFAAVATAQVDVLVLGPTGTGKNQLARALHDASSRRGPFVEVNCASIPADLAESELFGSTRGAFTGAVDRDGAVAQAERGTLFLDEIGDMPLAQQSKLLRLLQAREYDPVGASGRSRRADIRVVAATSVDLKEAIRQGRFREDLWYRLAVLPIRVPRLEERRDDIPHLVRALLHQLRSEGYDVAPLSPGAHAALETASWPGNVRELRNALLAGMLRTRARGGAVVESPDLFPGSSDTRPQTYHEATRAFQREFLRRRLRACDWDIAAVQQEVDLSRSQLYQLIRAFDLRRESEESDAGGADNPVGRIERKTG